MPTKLDEFTPTSRGKHVMEKNELIKTRLLYWPIDVAIKRMIDLDQRSRAETPTFFAEFAKVSPQVAKDLYAKARDGFLADLIASPKGERLTKANSVIHMAALRQTLQGLDSAFFTAAGLTKFEGDKNGYDAAMDVLQRVGPIESLAGEAKFGFVYDFQDQQLKPMSFLGMNALIGDPAIGDPDQELRPGRDFGGAIDTASTRYGIDSAAEADCEGAAKRIGHWVGAGVGGFVGGLGGQVVGESVGGTIGWIAGGPFGAAPGAVAGGVIGTVIGSTTGGEYGADGGEAVGSWLGGVICGGGSDPKEPSPRPAPTTGAGSSPSPSEPSGGGSSSPPPSEPSGGGSSNPPPSEPSAGGSSNPPPAPETSGSGDDGGHDGGDDGGDGGDGGDDGEGDDVESMVNPNWDDGTSPQGGEGGRDPSLRPKFGPRVVVSRWFNPEVTDPVNPMFDPDGRTIAFDMASLPQAIKLDRGYAVSLNGFANALREVTKGVRSVGGLVRPGITDVIAKDGRGDLGGLGDARSGALGSIGAGLGGSIDKLHMASLLKTEGEGLNAQESLRLIGEGVARQLLRG
jgi:hypothetical protein